MIYPFDPWLHFSNIRTQVTNMQVHPCVYHSKSVASYETLAVHFTWCQVKRIKKSYPLLHEIEVETNHCCLGFPLRYSGIKY
jgi:hypothetical protein